MACNQICFTRISGQNGIFGWQAVNASPQLPQNAVAAFTSLQNANINPPEFDEDDEQRVVLELQMEGANVFYTGIDCDAGADDRGRPIMFAHAFVFDLNKFIRCPQDILTIKDENFRFTIEDTMSAPEALSKYEFVSLRQCASAVGLTEEHYITLLQCVFQLLSAKTRNTLHVVCDCQPRTIRNIMTCVYLALPFNLRKRVSFSTHEFPNGNARTIVFDRCVRDDGRLFFDLKSGEQNLLTDTILRRLSRYEFIPHVPRSLDFEKENDAYFDALERELELIDSADTANLDLYKIAVDLLNDEKLMDSTNALTQEQLSTRMNELLSAPISHPYLDQQIQYLLSDIVERRILLNDVLSEKLCRKLEATRNRDLIECGHQYNSARINSMSVEDGAKYLFNAYQDRSSESFLGIKEHLRMDSKGREILKYLYVHFVAEEMAVNDESISAFHRETQFLVADCEIQRCICNLVFSYAKSELVPKTTNPVDLVYRVQYILSGVLSNRRDLQAEVLDGVKHQYWNNFKYEMFDVDVGEDYKAVEVDDSIKCQMILNACAIYEEFKKNDCEGLRTASEELSQKELSEPFCTGRKVLVGKILEACIAEKDSVCSNRLDIWLIVANLLLVKSKNENPIFFLMKKKISPIFDAGEAFEKEYDDSELLKEEDYCEKFKQWLAECAQDKSEYSPKASEMLKTIKIAEKKKKRESKIQKRSQESVGHSDGGAKETLIAKVRSEFSGFLKNYKRNNKK